MYQCFATIETENASKYLQQMCKHFAHKVSVEFTSERARIDLPPGLCVGVANDAELSFFCRSVESKSIKVMQSILGQHLVKFAWREELDIFWQDGIPDNAPEDVQAEFGAVC